MIRFSLTILISAFLLFQVQPLIARYILPWFGGTPAVWTTCMLFFQLLLLVGYAYSHFMTSLVKPKAQAAIHIALLLIALLCLPIVPSESLKPRGDESPTLQILLLLTITIGLPYVLLSTTGPLVQAWFARRFPGRSPYRLFAISNFGSLVALISYPFVFEPRLRLSEQAEWWSWGFIAFVAVCCWCAISSAYMLKTNSLKKTNEEDSDSTDDRELEVVKSVEINHEVNEGSSKPSFLDLTLWILLSAIPSVLLLASTSQLCQEVAVVAFLWVLPLSLYLLTFIICFDNPFWYQRVPFGVAMILLIALAVVCLFLGNLASLPLQIAAFSGALFVACMACHGELAASKPEAKYLTLFYLMISIGGALGGVFVVVVAPRIFSDYWELHFGYLAAAALTCFAFIRNGHWPALRLVLQGAALCGTILLVVMAMLYSETFFDLKAYRTLLIAATVFSILFALFGFGRAAGNSDEPRENTISESDIVSNVDQIPPANGASLLVTAAIIGVGLLLANLASHFLVKETDWLESKQLGSLSVEPGVLIAGISIGLIALAFAGRFLIKSRLPDVAKGRFFRGAGNAVHCVGLVLLVAGLGFALYQHMVSEKRDVISQERDFYGILRVRAVGAVPEEGELDNRYHKLFNGKTLHGQQFIAEDRRDIVTGYYSPESGIGLAIENHPKKRNAGDSMQRTGMKIGVIGLGVGTLAAYGDPDDIIKFYEINPRVEQVAREHFYYLSESRANVEVSIGDARIEMERELETTGSEQFDVLAIDAFSSDAIPRHLLTAECLQLYLKHLAPNGVLAFHISNRHLELEPVVLTLVRREGLIPGFFHYKPETDEKIASLVVASNWALVSRSRDFWTAPGIVSRRSNSKFMKARFKELPAFQNHFDSEDEFGESTLNVADDLPDSSSTRNKQELRIAVSGNDGGGELVMRGLFKPGDPDAILLIEGTEYPLHANFDDKFYWTDDFGSLWDVTR